MRVGGNPWGEYFQGTIDNVFVYSGALSAAEIGAIRAGGAAAVSGVRIGLKADNDSGASNADRLTNDNTPTFQVSVNLPGRIDLDYDRNGTADATRTVAGAGTYDFTAPTLADGACQIQATLVPDTGVTVTSTVDVTIDTAGPSLGSSAAGQALLFNGAEQVVVPSSPSLTPARQVTFEAWLKVDRFTNTWTPLLQKSDEFAASGAGRAYSLWLNNTGYLHLTSSDGAQQNVESPAGAIVAGRWQHVAGVIDRVAGQLQIFVDGQLVASGGVRTTDMVPTRQPLLLGDTYESWSGLGKFAGTLDEVRVWNVARSQAALQADMRRTLAGTEAGLAGYWRLDETDGTTVADATANHNDGRLGNGVARLQPRRTPSTAPLAGTGSAVTPPAVQRTVVASEPLDPATLAAAQVVLTGPDGANLGTAETLAYDNRGLTAAFSPQYLTGVYTLAFAPVVRDLAGNLLDQDADGGPGESGGDVFRETFTVLPDTAPPRVLRYGPLALAGTSFSRARLEFSEPVDPASLTSDNVTVSGPGGAISAAQITVTPASDVQWADSVLAFSSQYGTGGYSAAQTLGAPNTTSYGDRSTAWTTSSANMGLQSITVAYDEPGYASGVTVRETYNPGFVRQIDLLDMAGGWHQVWAGADPSPPGAIADFRVDFATTPYRVRGVKVTIDTAWTTSWEEIDAIGLHATPAPNVYSSFDVTFPAQTQAGTYPLTVGPDVRDLSGQRLDQDGDGRPGESEDAFSPQTVLTTMTTVSGAISADTTWSGNVRVTGDVTVNAGKRLTVAAGSIVKFDTGVRLQVSGTLLAQGTSQNPIVFTASTDDSVGVDVTGSGISTAAAGDWENVVFESGSTGSVLTHVQVRYAGNAAGPGNTSYYRTAIQVNGGDPALTDVHVVHSDAAGVGPYAGAPSLTRVTVDNARFAAFEGELAAQPVLSGLAASNSGVNGYELNGGTLTANRTWSFGGLPAYIDREITVNAAATVTIPAGQVFKLRGYGDLEFYGGLNAVGTAAEPIVFTSFRDDSVGGDTNGDGLSVPLAGDWDELYFRPTGTVALQHVLVRYAGNNSGPYTTDYRGSLVIDDTTPADSTITMQNVQVWDADSYGVYIQVGAPQLTNVSVSRARHDAFRGSLSADPALANLSAAASGGNRYLIDGGTFSGVHTWSAGGLPIQLSGDLTVGTGSELTIAAGQVVKFPQGAYLSVAGALRAAGTPELPVVFTSWRDDAVGGDANNDGAASVPAEGDWESLYMEPGSDASLLEYVQLRYAGNWGSSHYGSGYVPALRFRGTAATARHVQVAYADAVGVRFESGSPTLDDIQVTRSRSYAYSLGLTAHPLQTNLTARDNWADACVIDSGTFNDNTLDITTLPYALANDISVAAGKTLTIAAGVVVKLGNGYDINVDGTLKALGTLAEPIVFTSTRDDAELGDTFHDGPTEPSRGDWGWLKFNAASTASELDHVDLRYGGNWGSPGYASGYSPTLRIHGSSPTIRNTRVLHTDWSGVEILGGQPSLEQVSVHDARSDAFTMDLAAQPTLVGLSASGSNGNRVGLQGGTLGGNLVRTWNTDGLPLQLTSDVVIPATSTVNIGPGQVVKLAQGVYLSVAGRLNAIGAPAQPIVFTSFRDDSVGGDANNDRSASGPAEGDWESLYLEPGSDLTTLEHVQIRYAGNWGSPHYGGGYVPAVRFRGTAATARHMQVLHSDWNGVRIEGGSPTLDDVRVSGARGWAFNANLAATPTTTSLAAVDNWYDAYVLDTGHLASPQQLRLTATTLPYALTDDVIVDAGATLTLDPGVALKLGSGQYLRIDGTLDVNGTASQGVLLTSRRDDTVFGDTFHDGLNLPQAGDWTYLHINAGGTATLDNLTVRYAGNWYSPGEGGGNARSLYVDGATAATNLQVRDGDWGGVVVRNGATLTVTGGVLANNDDRNLSVEAGQANLTGVGIFSSPIGISVASGAAAVVTGSAFSPLADMPTAMTHAGNSFANADARGNWWGHAGGPYDALAADGRQNLNPAAPVVSDWVDYSGFLTSPPALSLGPYVVAVAGDTTARSVWPGDGDAVDTTGQHPGALLGGATFATGRVGQAFSLDGIDDSVDLGPWGPGTAWTTAAWVKATSVPATGRRGIVGGFAENRDWGLSLLDGKLVATMRRGGGVNYVNSGVAPVVDTWVHVVSTNDGQTAKVYVDGQLKASGPVDANYLATAAGARIGGEVCCGGNNFPGLIDEVAIIARALSDAEVASLFQGTWRPTTDSLDVTFSQPIDLGTFTAADLAVSGPQATTVGAPAMVGAATYRVPLAPPLTADGSYQISVGPAIAARSGYLLDQDRDATGGEPVQDVFLGAVTIDRTGPRIVDSTPTGVQPGAVEHVDVTFSEAVRAATFTPNDVRITSPAGAVQPLSVTPLSPTVVRIGFATQSLNGAYAIQVGPHVSDLAGNELDQDLDGAGGESADDVYTGTFSISLEPVWISSQTPTGTLTTAVDHVDVTFAVPILATSFTPADVRLTGPLGLVPITSVSHVLDNTYRIAFAALTAEGDYTALVGPEITDAAGNLMDQDRDATRGEPEDRYPASFRILAVGPRALGHVPNSTVAAPVSFLDVTFSEPLQLGSFTPVDVVLTGPQGGVAVTGVAALGNNAYRLSFAPQTLTGAYHFVLGPYVNDLGGTPLNQDGDPANGEPDEDAYGGSFSIDNTPPAIAATEPTGQLPQYFSNLTLTFSEPIVATSFTTADVTLTGPNGPLSVSSVAKLDDTRYRVYFATQSAVGTYRFTVGPQIVDQVGNAMDSNGNGVFGEADDAAVIEIGVVLPDLTVSSTTVPATVAAGGSLNVAWVLRNAGGAAVAVPWSDRVVLSRDAYYGNWDDLQIAAVTSSQPLGANATESRQAAFTVPFGLEGSYYVLFRLDHYNAVQEANESNNLVSAPIEVLYSQPPADLVVDTVTVPATGASGQEVSISWRVTNRGTAATEGGRWSDRVYLSADTTFGGDVALGIFQHDGTLAADGSYAQVQNIWLPVNLAAGPQWVIVQSDYYGQLAEPGGENNNVTRSAAAIDVSLSPVPDLVVSSVGGPAGGVIGQTASVTWTVRNDGGLGATAPWSDHIYLSTTGTTSGATWLGSFVRDTALAAAAEYARTETVTLPVKPDGDYFFVVVTDGGNQVFERGGDGEAANTRASAQAMRLNHPDLIVNVVSPTGTPEAGRELDLTWSARNAGTGATSAAWSDRVYLSRDNSLSADDVLLATEAHAGVLAANEPYQPARRVRLPNGIEGTYYLLVSADALNQVTEGVGEGNNVRASAALNVVLPPYADLAVDRVTVEGQDGGASKLIIGDPADLTVAWRVANVGTGAGDVDTWRDRVVLSPDAIVGNGDDRVIGEFEHQGAMPVGTEYTRREVIPLPAGLTGRFQLFVVTDATDVVYEHTGAGANSAGPGQPVDVTPIPYADLLVDTVAAPATGQSGQSLSVAWTVSNAGLGLTNVTEWTDRVWFSSDPAGQSGLTKLGDFSHVGSLGVGDTYTRRVDVTLPAAALGVSYLFIDTDAQGRAYEFIYDGNNRTRSSAVAVEFVPPPPVDLQALSVSGPATASDGGGFDVTWSVRNNGPQAVSGQWVDTVYLAPDGDFNRATVLGRFTNSQGLGAGLSYSRTERFQFPLYMQGVYQFYVQTDVDGAIAETNEANNRLGAAAPITITLQPRADLQVTSLLIPQTVPGGGAIDVEFTVTNLGSAATPTGGSRWQDAVYWSLNNTWDGGDVLLGKLDNGSALAVGEAYTTRANYVLPQALASQVYIIVRADIGGRVDEYPYENNNSLARPLAVDVTPVPPPDLVVTEVAGPGDAFDDSNIVVHYQVTNLGAGITYPASWTDTVWLTLGTDRPDPNRGDKRLGSFSHSGALEVGEFYTNDVTVRLPKNTRGQYFLTVWTDALDRVWEEAFDINVNPDAPHDLEGSNFKATPLTVLYTPPADLEVMQVAAAPTAVEGGQRVTVSWTVQNNGAIVTDQERWADAVYVSTDPDLHDGQGTAHMVFGVPHFGALEPGQSYSEEVSFTLPPSAEGSYFIVETNVDPRQIMTEEDLLLTEMQEFLQRVEARLGKPLADVSLADIQSLSREDLLKIIIGGPQPATVFEGPFTDNNQRATAAAVTNRPPDLRVTSITLPPADQAFSGEEVTIAWTVTNQGVGPVWAGTQGWRDQVWLSLDPVFSCGRSVLLGTRVNGPAAPLAPGESSLMTGTFRLPAGLSGRRYVHVFTDRDVTQECQWGGIDDVGPGQFPDWPGEFRERVWEDGQKANNTLAAAFTVTYREPDLTLASLTVAATGNSGGILPIQWTVENQGTRETRVATWYDRVYISTDPSLDMYDQLLGSVKHTGAVAPGGSYSAEAEVRLPDNIEAASTSSCTSTRRTARRTPRRCRTRWPKVRTGSNCRTIRWATSTSSRTRTTTSRRGPSRSHAWTRRTCRSRRSTPRRTPRSAAASRSRTRWPTPGRAPCPTGRTSGPITCTCRGTRTWTCAAITTSAAVSTPARWPRTKATASRTPTRCPAGCWARTTCSC